jgi:G:T-mismatch repair DNA endonuclease (very short patch repair protein)
MKNGYKVLVIWDYELKNLENVKNKILEFEGDIV